MLKLTKGTRLLFDGDSITDSCRDRDNFNSLAGYTSYIAAEYGKNVECINRGISGYTTRDILARLENQLEELKPQAYSLLIGINDVWREFDADVPCSDYGFENRYRAILETVKKYTQSIIVLEPFLIPSDPAKAVFRTELDPKIQIVRKVAREYKTVYIPLDGIFAEASVVDSPEKYSFDGVHPTDEGFRLIAKEFCKRVTL